MHLDTCLVRAGLRRRTIRGRKGEAPIGGLERWRQGYTSHRPGGQGDPDDVSGRRSSTGGEGARGSEGNASPGGQCRCPDPPGRHFLPGFPPGQLLAHAGSRLGARTVAQALAAACLAPAAAPPAPSWPHALVCQVCCCCRCPLLVGPLAGPDPIRIALDALLPRSSPKFLYHPPTRPTPSHRHAILYHRSGLCCRRRCSV